MYTHPLIHYNVSWYFVFKEVVRYAAHSVVFIRLSSTISRIGRHSAGYN